MRSFKISNINFSLFIISFALFSFTFYKAYTLSITWDEAFSYLEYIRNGIYIEPHFVEMSANNHFLNTWLGIHLVKLFGVSELVLRIPSLIAHLIFLFSSAKIVLRFSNKWLVVASFLIINCNPYLLDFFSLSRGYALSTACMLWSIHYLINYISEEYKLKFAIYSILTAALAVLANMVLLNYFVVLVLLISFLLLYRFIKQKELRQSNAIHFIVIENLAILFLLFIVPITFKLRAAGAFYYGANHSFWTDTVSTSIVSCLYGLNYGYWLIVLLKIILLIALIGSVVYLFFAIRKKEITTQNIILFSLLFIIGFTALASIVQHYLLHSLYLMDRTTQFYIVLFNVFLVYLINTVFGNKKIANYLMSFFLGLTLIHFALCFNFSYVWEWKTNSCIKQMVENLEKEVKPDSKKPLISVGMPLAYEMGINYYRVTKKLHWLNTPDRREQTNVLHDYWLLENDSLKALKKRKSIDIIQTYEQTQSAFAKPRLKPQQSKTVFRNTFDYTFSDEGVFKLSPEREFSPDFNIKIHDSLITPKNKMIVVKYKLKVPYFDIHNTAIVLSLESSGRAYLWKSIVLKDYIKDKSDWNDIYLYCIAPKEMKDGDVIKSYIWNKSTKNIFILKAEIKLLEYK